MSSQRKDTSDLPLVPESVLKKRHDLDDLRRRRRAQETAASIQKTSRKSKHILKPETILARARSRKHAEIRYNRVLKKGMQKRASNQKEFKTKELPSHNEDSKTIQYQCNSVGANMVFCVRIHNHVGLPFKVRKVLDELHLHKIHQGTFCQYDAETRKRLHLCEPFVVYGKPSKGVLEDLITRRASGYDQATKERVPLSDNRIVEENLQEHNVLCIQDIVEELDTVGPAFKPVCKFLGGFSLADPLTKFQKKQLNVTQKQYGDMGQAIDEYIQRVL